MNEQKDEYELRLDETIEELTQCHAKLGVRSCVDCEQVFTCKIRSAYVDAVYASMSKGASGGFDF
ncbi:hypothetical protein [Campylobacter sp. 19-13652]|uniref:hypothetical protein n=1 Tax=Campylobacter sp. 19-13652 TaxID=2840180 RepID=UPI001C7475E2|nr:hypothetical protein [Campylobacter sp. 19-13652]BCX79032.1 hypothetical protein LBC_04940 [Campylobacter sp. 19-13652]